MLGTGCTENKRTGHIDMILGLFGFWLWEAQKQKL